jgi:hypothetical protein
MTHLPKTAFFKQTFEQHRVLQQQLQGSSQACIAPRLATNATAWGLRSACGRRHLGWGSSACRRTAFHLCHLNARADTARTPAALHPRPSRLVSFHLLAFLTTNMPL